MAQRPVTYLNNRTQTFATYLINYRVVWAGVVENDLGIAPRFPSLAESLRQYVGRVDLSLSIVFVPALWLVIAGLLTTQRRARTPFGTASRMLGLSSLLYIVAYFPVVPAIDFRYTYWPVIACCVAVVLYAMERTGADAVGGEAS